MNLVGDCFDETECPIARHFEPKQTNDAVQPNTNLSAFLNLWRVNMPLKPRNTMPAIFEPKRTTIVLHPNGAVSAFLGGRFQAPKVALPTFLKGDEQTTT